MHTISWYYYPFVKQESLANAKVSARQPWYGRNSLNRLPRIVQQYQCNLYIVEKYFQCAFSAQQFRRWQCGFIFIHLAVFASQKCQAAQNSDKIWTYSSSRPSKVDDFGANRKRICDFLLVINSNFGPSTVSEIRRLICWKLRIFIPLSYSPPPPLIFPLEFHREVKRQKTRIMGLVKVAWS